MSTFAEAVMTDGPDVTMTRLVTHEAVCAERWQRILERISRLEAIVLVAAGTLIASMGGLIVTLALRGGK